MNEYKTEIRRDSNLIKKTSEIRLLTIYNPLFKP